MIRTTHVQVQNFFYERQKYKIKKSYDYQGTHRLSDSKFCRDQESGVYALCC